MIFKFLNSKRLRGVSDSSTNISQLWYHLTLRNFLHLNITLKNILKTIIYPLNMPTRTDRVHFFRSSHVSQVGRTVRLVPKLREHSGCSYVLKDSCPSEWDIKSQMDFRN